MLSDKAWESLEMVSPVHGDPICTMGGKWYFFIETWHDVEGPFDTEEIARAELKRYCDEYLQ